MTHVETHEYLGQTKDERIAELERILGEERAKLATLAAAKGELNES